MEISTLSTTVKLPPFQKPSSISSSKSSLFLNQSSTNFFRSIHKSGMGLKAQTRPTNMGTKRFTCNALFGLGVPELAVIAGVAALVFGPKQLPEIGKNFGKTIKSFQQWLRRKICQILTGNSTTSTLNVLTSEVIGRVYTLASSTLAARSVAQQGGVQQHINSWRKLIDESDAFHKNEKAEWLSRNAEHAANPDPDGGGPKWLDWPANREKKFLEEVMQCLEQQL